MSSFSARFAGLLVGQYREIGVPSYIAKDLPDCASVRMFATPSWTFPDEGYYLQAIKSRKAGWGNGSATIVCSCLNSMFKAGIILSGLRTPCKHAKGLRAYLSARSNGWKKIEG
jgi:hypothetical protein